MIIGYRRSMIIIAIFGQAESRSTGVENNGKIEDIEKLKTKYRNK